MVARRVVVVLGAFAAGFLVWGAFAVINDHRKAVVAPMQPAPPVFARIMALGRIEPVSELVKIAGPATQDSGRIAEIRMGEGDWVEKGQILAVLDTRARLQAAVQQAEAILALRRAALAKTIADLDNQEKTLLAALEQQEAQRDRAKWEFERLQQLQKSGLYREPALIDKKLVLESANFALDSARLLLERNRQKDVGGLRVDEAAGRAEVANAEAALVRASADLEFSLIRAPLTGRIIRRLGRVGEQIGQEGFAEIADTRVMNVRAEVFESDLRHVTPGDAASITSRSLDGVFTGRVERVGLKVNRQSIIGEDPATALDARVVEVVIRLDSGFTSQAAGLIGLQVRVSIGAGKGS